jgi:hypothetical protein
MEPAAAAQPAQGSSEPVAPRIIYFILFILFFRYGKHKNSDAHSQITMGNDVILPSYEFEQRLVGIAEC